LTRTPKSVPSSPEDRRREAAAYVLDQRWAVIREALGPRYADCRVDTFDVTDPEPKYAAAKRKAVDQVRGYLDDLRENVRAGRNVLLFGPKGTGKDHLMVGMLHEAVYDGASARWWDGMTLYAELFRLWKEKQSEGPLFKKLVEADVFAISDPVPPRGQAVNEAVAGFLFRVVDGRYRRRRPIWVTANFASKKEAEERMAPQIHDRLRDGAVQIACNWESYRSPES